MSSPEKGLIRGGIRLTPSYLRVVQELHALTKDTDKSKERDGAGSGKQDPP